MAAAPPTVLPYDFDRVDPRIARDTDGDGDLDEGQAFANIPFPNANAVFSLVNEPLQRGLPPFGGDYTGIIPCQSPDTTLFPTPSAAQNHIATGGTQGCWTNVYRGVLAPGVPRGRNIANTGGRGELPMIDACWRSVKAGATHKIGVAVFESHVTDHYDRVEVRKDRLENVQYDMTVHGKKMFAETIACTVAPNSRTFARISAQAASISRSASSPSGTPATPESATS